MSQNEATAEGESAMSLHTRKVSAAASLVWTHVCFPLIKWNTILNLQIYWFDYSKDNVGSIDGKIG